MKLFIILILSLIYLFGAIWVFNHVNPWIALAMPTGYLGYLVYLIEKKLKK